jgi:hypothetical protein
LAEKEAAADCSTLGDKAGLIREARVNVRVADKPRSNLTL